MLNVANFRSSTCTRELGRSQMTLQFPDVSHYQAGLSLRGAPAVLAKSTQGSSFTDGAYAAFRQQAAQLGIPFAAYHWVDGSDLGAQAAHAHAIVGSTPIMWDAEAAGATVSRLVDLTNRLRQLGGHPRLVYLPHWWWQNLGSPDLRPLERAGLRLVSSSYPAAGYTENGPGWAAYGGITPVIWQWSESHRFNGQQVDFNAYKGTVNDLRALLGLTPTVPVPVPPIPTPRPPAERPANMLIKDTHGTVYVSDGVHRYAVPPASVGDATWVTSHAAQYSTGTPVQVDDIDAFGAPAGSALVTLSDAQLATLADLVAARLSGMPVGAHEHTVPPTSTGPAVPSTP